MLNSTISRWPTTGEWAAPRRSYGWSRLGSLFRLGRRSACFLRPVQLSDKTNLFIVRRRGPKLIYIEMPTFPLMSFFS